VIGTHAREFYILDDVTPLQQLADALGRPMALFPPVPAVRFNPAADVSVLGNDEWIAPNPPYGALLTYWLGGTHAMDAPLRIEVVDASGRIVRTLRGTNRAGLNRIVWDLSEASVCASADDLPPPSGPGGPFGRGGATWLRALPGEYTIRLVGAGQTVEQPLRVRLDPRIALPEEDLLLWHREAKKIERMDCMLDEAAGTVRSIDARLGDIIESDAGASLRSDAEALRAQLRPIALGLYGDVRDPGHINLSGRVNWLTIQVGNYTGRPTDAQMEWIARWAEMTDEYVEQLDDIISSSLASFNIRLRAAGLPAIGAG
jgi:hypothetical protein